jgi:ABC-type multidrug transport system ATPase subunit
MDKGARTLKDLFRSLAGKGDGFSTHSISVAEELVTGSALLKGRLIACGAMPDLYGQAKNKNGNLESVFLELTQAPSPDETASG